MTTCTKAGLWHYSGRQPRFLFENCFLDALLAHLFLTFKTLNVILASNEQSMAIRLEPDTGRSEKNDFI